MILTLRLDPKEDEIVEQLKHVTGQNTASKAVMVAVTSYAELCEKVKRLEIDLAHVRGRFNDYQQVVDNYKAARADFDNLRRRCCVCGLAALPDMNVCADCM